MKVRETTLKTALRYAQVPADESGHTKILLEELQPLLEKCTDFRFSARLYPLKKQNGKPQIQSPSPLILPGNSAKTMLNGCDFVIVLAATLGTRFDRQLASLQICSPARALLFDALGSALIDQLLDEQTETLRAQLAQSGRIDHPIFLTDRFSCGYGDLPLSLQDPLCALADAQRQCGIHIHASQMMSPSKSVSALIGIAPAEQPARIRGCAFCRLQNCSIRPLQGGLCHV